jgi:preprotein translocase subunit SecA
MRAPPLKDYRRTDYRVPTRPLTGLDAVVNRFIGQYRARSSVAATLFREANAIIEMESSCKDLTNADLQRRLLDFRELFRRGGGRAEEQVGPALAAIREAADRQLGLRAFPVQIMGALTLHRGLLAEMGTGEGKTLTAGLAAVLAGWSGRPTHVITVNDYLVERDSSWLKTFYHFCGIRVGHVVGSSPPPERVKGYECDVTYVVSKELLADFLRDRLHLGGLQDPTRRLIRHLLKPKAATQSNLVLRGLHTAIVDEADGVLIDEAVTPLIISAAHQNEALRDAARMAHQMVGELQPGYHYHLNLRYKEVELTPHGMERLVEHSRHLPGLWRGPERRLELIIQALVAREFFHRDRQYILDDGKIVIVDEFTGRPMPQRTWQAGMHQAVEAKEGVEISEPSETIARLSFQRFFRCFYKLSGMTGTARETAAEFWQSYSLAVIAIPPNRPCRRQQWPDHYFATELAKWQAIVEETRRVHALGRPVLIGTRNIAASEQLGNMLSRNGLEPRVLNATRLKEEADVVALAGNPGHITIATNMAGRGTDIKLGERVSEAGGLHVIATERHESGRIDRQLFGRSGRQGDPGSAQAFVSLEDELIIRYLPAPARRMLDEAWHRNSSNKERLLAVAWRYCQAKAQNVARKQRQAVLRSDLWMDQALSFAGADTI